ncbi:hypothetical protein ACHAXS_001823 [Conticribra weissflogii]
MNLLPRHNTSAAMSMVLTIAFICLIQVPHHAAAFTPPSSSVNNIIHRKCQSSAPFFFDVSHRARTKPSNSRADIFSCYALKKDTGENVKKRVAKKDNEKITSSTPWSKIFLAFLNPLRNPNSLFLYLLLIVTVLGKINENKQ